MIVYIFSWKQDMEYFSICEKDVGALRNYTTFYLVLVREFPVFVLWIVYEDLWS